MEKDKMEKKKIKKTFEQSLIFVFPMHFVALNNYSLHVFVPIIRTWYPHSNQSVCGSTEYCIEEPSLLLPRLLSVLNFFFFLLINSSSIFLIVHTANLLIRTRHTF